MYIVQNSVECPRSHTSILKPGARCLRFVYLVESTCLHSERFVKDSEAESDLDEDSMSWNELLRSVTMPGKEEWDAAAARAAAAAPSKSAMATPLPRSPKQALSKQGSVPVSSVNTPASSLPPIKTPKPQVQAPSRGALLPPVLSKKKQFAEKFVKDRLSKRDFAHIRHDPYYKDLTKPERRESLSYADHHRKEFWRTDVESVLKREEDQRRARQKELFAIWTNEEAWRRHRATKIREMKYNAFTEMSERMQKVGCRNNRSGAPHINIITRQALGADNEPIDEGPIVAYLQDVSKYKTIQRKLLLRARNSGARNFNILNWTENPPGPALPPWPEKPPTPPPPPPPKPDLLHINTSKGPLSYARLMGPFGVVDTN